MHHAKTLSPTARRTFRRLLVLAQNRGLGGDVVARSAAQAEENS
jgi:hypothetical protein